MPPKLVQRMVSRKLKLNCKMTRGKVTANLNELNNMVSSICAKRVKYLVDQTFICKTKVGFICNYNMIEELNFQHFGCFF